MGIVRRAGQALFRFEIKGMTFFVNQVETISKCGPAGVKSRLCPPTGRPAVG